MLILPLQLKANAIHSENKIEKAKSLFNMWLFTKHILAVYQTHQQEQDDLTMPQESQQEFSKM